MSTTIPFKSERAAKIAYTKAEKTFEAARDACTDHTCKCRETGWDDEAFAERARLDGVKDKAFDAMAAVYEKATKEGHFIKSWHCGSNPTRDLIAANMD